MSATWVPLILIVMNVVYAISAYPLGKLSDNGNRHKLLVWGIVFLIMADLILALAANVWVAGPVTNLRRLFVLPTSNRLILLPTLARFRKTIGTMA